MNRKHNDNTRIKSIVELGSEICEDIGAQLENDTSSKPSQTKATILFVEPFYGGSHKQLIDTLRKRIPHTKLISMTAKKWPWRARCSALVLSRLVPKITTEKVLFCSSVLSLAELLGLRPDLSNLKKIVYFHENQLVYPIRTIKDRDVQYAYNQITTCLAADLVLFNSNFNKMSFLDNIKHIIKLLPDFRPKGLREDIEKKCQVIYFPVAFPKEMGSLNLDDVLHIVWPHRWEFDKDPETFINILLRLKESKAAFHVSILGEQYKDHPDVFQKAQLELQDKILHFGYLDTKEEYYNVLRRSHVVVSTAKHEFFGVSTLEAAYCGSLPLVPKKLVYPEIYPEECCYTNEDELFNKLKTYCLSIEQYHLDKGKIMMKIDFNKYSSQTLLPFYVDLFK